ncbi:hypothetical protein QP585_24075 [Serratia ureilytica]|uniref:hypothetical protein n=1 Tax=Serratia ureilytica TaxID=300181 RepID=UPI0019CF5A4E|nr:hypothetical protein [Serratia ureilytica]MBN5226932.1 hypothetical protein [Serratia ureilytica]MDK7596190.1 hypothetical protein [Serratia ureilytica]
MFYGVICYVLSLALVLLFSILYIFRSSFMPYHQNAVQRQWHEVDLRMQKLLLALMHALGVAWLSWFFFCVYLLTILLSGPVLMWQLVVFQAFYVFSTLAPVTVAIRLRLQTGAKTPVVGGAMAAALSVLGFICILLS